MEEEVERRTGKKKSQELSSFKQIVPKELLTRLTHPLSDTDAIVAAE